MLHSSNEITTTSYWNATYSVEDNNFKTGYTKSLAQRKRLKISVENETHYVGIVNLTNTTVTINVSSDTQQKIFNIGNIYKFDVTNDNYYDIEVKLNNILDNKANITITSIHEEIIVEEVNETTINNQENQTINITNTTIIPEDANNTKEDNISTIPAKEKTVKENLYFFGLIIILIIVYIIINVIRKKTKKNKNRFDINNDGKFDEKDVTLAKKVIKFYKKKQTK